MQQPRLCHKSTGSGALVSPGGREDTNSLVVSGQTVDAGLDQNKAELAVLVFAVSLKMFADSDSLQVDESVCQWQGLETRGGT